jgi:hypothetical protein
VADALEEYGQLLDEAVGGVDDPAASGAVSAGLTTTSYDQQNRARRTPTLNSSLPELISRPWQ